LYITGAVLEKNIFEHCPSNGAGESAPSRKCILAYFEGHRTLLFAPIYMLILRVHQTVFHVTLGVGKADVWGVIVPLLNIEPSLTHNVKMQNFMELP